MQINVRIVFFCCHTIPNSPSFTSQVYIVICITVVYTFLEEKKEKEMTLPTGTFVVMHMYMLTNNKQLTEELTKQLTY